MKTKQEVALVFLLAAAINGAALFSFDQKKNQEKNKEGLDYQISVSAISIAVTVQDKGGSYIDNLTEGDFTIYENNVKQAITYFKHDFTTPLSLTVLLDVSGSMAIQDKLKESKEALNDLLTNLLGPNDEASLLIFADGEVEVAADFSTDKKKFLIELEKAEAYGQTALYDAVAVSPEFANKGKKEKRGLLLITDGIENDSQCTPEQAVEIARRVDVPIYTIGYKIPLNEQYLRKYKSRSDMSSAGIMATLKRFSQATGGKAFFINEPHELKAALREISRELSHQYILGYTSYKTPKNEYRRIRVATGNKNHRVRTREGY
jgi:Ca-activated chloride channel family protein